MSEQRAEGGVPEWTLGWRLKRALGYADISVQEMADHLELSRAQVSRYLNDKGPVRRWVIRQWALRCGVPFDWLAFGTVPDGPEGGQVIGESSSACTRLAQVIDFPYRNLPALARTA